MRRDDDLVHRIAFEGNLRRQVFHRHGQACSVGVMVIGQDSVEAGKETCLTLCPSAF